MNPPEYVVHRPLIDEDAEPQVSTPYGRGLNAPAL